MSVTQDEVNDYLDSIKGVLDTYVIRMVKELHKDLWQEHQKLTAENVELKKKLQEHQIIWEKEGTRL